MEKKYTPITITLLIIHVFRFCANAILLLGILLFDVFLVIDLITIVALVLISVAFIGLYLKQKWGAQVAIVNALFDIVLNFVFFSLGFVFATILNIFVIALAYKELKQIELYYQYLSEPTQTFSQAASNLPSNFTATVANYCKHCGAKLKGEFCHNCGKKAT
ncbi:MAG: hypothetical protein ACFFAO_07055 [Candidatus Hermodarchaeota archaeon]